MKGSSSFIVWLLPLPLLAPKVEVVNAFGQNIVGVIDYRSVRLGINLH